MGAQVRQKASQDPMLFSRTFSDSVACLTCVCFQLAPAPCLSIGVPLSLWVSLCLSPLFSYVPLQSLHVSESVDPVLVSLQAPVPGLPVGCDPRPRLSRHIATRPLTAPAVSPALPGGVVPPHSSQVRRAGPVNLALRDQPPPPPPSISLQPWVRPPLALTSLDKRQTPSG